MLSMQEVQKHTKADDVWVVIHGEAFDLSEFHPEHPGGSAIILKYAGKDATAVYDPIHPPNAISDWLPKDKHLGPVNREELKALAENVEETEEQKELKKRHEQKPALQTLMSLYDIEAVGLTLMSKQAAAYYSSGSDDEITMRENRAAYQRLWFRPRVLRNVGKIDFSTTMLGTKTSMPLYITATALGKLGHPDGEKNLTWAAAQQDIIQMIPTLASCSFEEICDAAVPSQTQWMQLYVNQDRKVTERIVRRAEQRGIKGLFITVDAPQLGRRERDMRMKFAEQGSNVQSGDGSVDNSQGAARAISSFIDPNLSWDDIPWFKSITKMPIILKGVQCWEDAVIAAEMGVQGIVLSNHGGRQLDFARSGIEILPEVVAALKQRGLFKPSFEIFVDGGVRRAGDIIKAVALGAKGVGIGRPLLYAYAAYGVPGVVRAIQILKDEFEMNMRLSALRGPELNVRKLTLCTVGAPTLADLKPEMVDTSAANLRIVDMVPDFKARQNYEPLPKAHNMPMSKL